MTTIIYTVVDIFYEIVYYQNGMHQTALTYWEIRLENDIKLMKFDHRIFYNQKIGSRSIFWGHQM